MEPRIGFLAQPLFGQVVELGPALKGAVAHEEMLFDVADHALVFAFGAGTIRAAGAGREAVVRREVEKALVESKGVTLVDQHGGFLIVDQHLLGDAVEVLQAADQPLVGVFGIVVRRAPEVKAPGIAQLIDDEVDLGRLAGELGDEFTPIALELVAGRGLEAHGGPPRAEGTLGGHVVAQDGVAARIAGGAELTQDHDAVPDPLSEQLSTWALNGSSLLERRARGEVGALPRCSARRTVLG